MCLCRLELAQFDDVTQWLVDLRLQTDCECMCILEGKSLTADSSEIIDSPPKLISGQLLLSDTQTSTMQCAHFVVSESVHLYSSHDHLNH